jgi:hypothetical protein
VYVWGIGSVYAVSYASVNHDLVAHRRKFVKRLVRMYNSDTSKVRIFGVRVGRFEMFEPTRKPVLISIDTSTMAYKKGLKQ